MLDLTSTKSLFDALCETENLHRVVDWATHKVTIHPAFADDLRQEIMIELAAVPASAAIDAVKLGSTVARRISLKFKMRMHGVLAAPGCEEANFSRVSNAPDSNSIDDALLLQLDPDLLVFDTPDVADADASLSIRSMSALRGTRASDLLDQLSPALYRVARHLVRGENITFIAAAEQTTEASVRTMMHRITHAIATAGKSG